ncbi:alpha/beta fold hydrolase [Phytohabitans sp. ZYX-F-186]|uniref:Alpha/beta fold hydrolase n=1 Tax=Phytohabitans maris TaxID=3071409 RepID=A0ABU0ZCA7_9ACTN|nr:alpha/beta fold hydrolase [Phytohabitans sp. ZYX-F-186]MDQ7903577.1 alpha/beta fold hydrolase [Phytohabitans sp. ZYX-F-186]
MGVDLRLTDPATGSGVRALEVPGEWTSIGHRLRYLARVTPGAPALASPGAGYTYGELLGTAERWAGALHAVPAGAPVAIDVEPTADCAAAVVAVVLSGRAAVLLDPMLPSPRSARILAASGAHRLDVAALAALPATGEPLPDGGLDDPAVLLFTSGSTGRPKGVVHSHRSWLGQAYAYRVAMELDTADRHALVLPLSFGGGLDVLFTALLTGASAHVYDPRVLGLAGMAGWLREQRVSAVYATPALLRSILDAPGAADLLAGLRHFTTCGEAIHASLVERLRERMGPDSTYVGWSGASEIGTLAYLALPAAAPVPPGILPVGRPAPLRDVEVVDEDGRPVPPGVTGEVAVTSRHISSGYHADPEATAKRFRRNADGTTTYRGGDLGRWDGDGLLHLAGRADAAVKVGGYLVEPAEVEAALLDSPDVREAVVTAVPATDETGAVRSTLVAHVVPVTRERAVTPASVRRALRERLPSWMVPARIVLLTELPRNERGKVDRPALPPVPDRRPVPPATPTEKLLAEIWRGVLGLADVPANADFWELGADSLAVERMMVATRRATGTAVTSAGLTAAPTIAELARLVDGGTRRGDLPPTAVTLRASAGPAPALFAYAGGGAAALSLLPLATALRVDVPVVGFQASGFEARGRLDWSLAGVVRRHLGTLRKVAPRGPYVLVGHSFGGMLALETAAALTAAGADVPLVVLLDTILPEDVAGPARRESGTPAPPAPAPPPLRRRLLMHARLAAAGIRRYPAEVREAVFWEQSLRMVNRHRLTTWNGRTLLFTAEDNPDQPAWWDRVLTGPHEVIPIAGGHSSILRPPFLQPIVDRLSAELSALRVTWTT